MRYCPDCDGAHTAACFERTADHIACCPDDCFAAEMLACREEWAISLRLMAKHPEHPKHQAARNLIGLFVKGVTRQV